MCDVEPVAITPIARLAIVVYDHTVPAHLLGSLTDCGVRMIIADTRKLEAARHVGSHDIAACLVEHGRLDTRVCGAKCLPVAEGCIERADIGIADEDGLKVHLRPLGIEQILRHYLSTQCRDIVALRSVSYTY
jgi:hypothetical protein